MEEEDKQKFKPSHIQLKRDYQKKEFVNPYFENQKPKSKFDTALYLKIMAVVLVLYVVFFSNLLKMDNINTHGFDMINQEEFNQVVNDELDSWRWYLLPSRHMIFFSKSRLADKINSLYSLENLSINRGWRKLDITVAEKVSYLIIFNAHDQTFYFADSEGDITSSLSQEDAERYWTRFPILNVNLEGLKIGDDLTTANTVSFILLLNEKIKDSRINIKGYELMGAGEVGLVTKDSWKVYFNIKSNLDVVLENLILVLNEKIEDPKKIEYIDLRFGDKVFYK